MTSKNYFIQHVLLLTTKTYGRLFLLSVTSVAAAYYTIRMGRWTVYKYTFCKMLQLKSLKTDAMQTHGLHG